VLAAPPTQRPKAEGFAVIANFKAKGVPRARRLLISAAFVVPLLGTTLSFFLVRGRPEIVQLSVLTFTAGVLMTVVVEEVVPQAHESGADSRVATVALVGGFALFALLSAYLGG
jgi:ZIP family zinc transporter